MAAMLSSQTRDEVTHAAMLRLRAHGCTPAHLLATDVEVLKQLLKPVSFYARKAEYIQNTSTILLAQYGGDIPSTLKELLALPGVGPKLQMDRSPLEPVIRTCAPHHTCTSTVMCWAPQYTTEVARSQGAVELWHLNCCSGTVLGWVRVYGVTGCTAESSRGGTGVSVHSGPARLSWTPREPVGVAAQAHSILTRVLVCGLRATLSTLLTCIVHQSLLSKTPALLS